MHAASVRINGGGGANSSVSGGAQTGWGVTAPLDDRDDDDDDDIDTKGATQSAVGARAATATGFRRSAGPRGPPPRRRPRGMRSRRTAHCVSPPPPTYAYGPCDDGATAPVLYGGGAA